jgi:hypothetical protein
VSELILSGVIWTMIVYSIQRGYRQQRRVDRYALLTWGIFVSIGVTLTARTPLLSQRLDGKLGDEPVTYWLKMMATLSAGVCYALSLKLFAEQSPDIYPLRRYHRWLLALAPGIAGAMSVVLAVGLDRRLSYLQTRYLIKLLLEPYMFLLIVLWFIPVNRKVYWQEQVTPMRVKHAATLVLCAAFALSSLLAMIFVPPILFTGHVNPGPALVPRHLIGAICLIVMLAPHRWIVLAGLPIRLLRYRRVTKLEHKLGKLVPMPHESLQWRRLLQPGYVDLATYVAVVNILDNYWQLLELKPPPNDLYRQLSELTLHHQEYDDLVRAMEQAA